MALAYPEGEVFFKRSSLHFNDHDKWNASNAEYFYSHVLIEYASNGYHSGHSTTQYSHPRATYVRKKADKYSAIFGYYDRLPLESNPNVFRDRDKGGPRTVHVHPIRMPNTEERWLWMDCTTIVRAIYLPVAQMADAEFDDLCTYVQISFYRQPEHRDVWHCYGGNDYRFRNVDFSVAMGYNYWNDWSFGINVPEVITLLSVPRKLRVTNIWKEKLVMFRKTQHIKTITPTTNPVPKRNLDFVTLVNASFAVELVWKPVPPQQTSFLTNLLGTILTSAAGLIPGIGPVLAVAFSVGWQAMTDPDGFKVWAKEGGWAESLVQAVVGSAPGAGKYIDKRWIGKGSFAANPFGAPPAIEMAPEAGDEVSDSVEQKNLDDYGPSPLLLQGLLELARDQKSEGEIGHEEAGSEGGETLSEARDANPDEEHGDRKNGEVSSEGMEVVLTSSALARAVRTSILHAKDAVALEKWLETSVVSEDARSGWVD